MRQRLARSDQRCWQSSVCQLRKQLPPYVATALGVCCLDANAAWMQMLPACQCCLDANALSVSFGVQLPPATQPCHQATSELSASTVLRIPVLVTALPTCVTASLIGVFPRAAPVPCLDLCSDTEVCVDEVCVRAPRAASHLLFPYRAAFCLLFQAALYVSLQPRQPCCACQGSTHCFILQLASAPSPCRWCLHARYMTRQAPFARCTFARLSGTAAGPDAVCVLLLTRQCGWRVSVACPTTCSSVCAFFACSGRPLQRRLHRHRDLYQWRLYSCVFPLTCLLCPCAH